MKGIARYVISLLLALSFAACDDERHVYQKGADEEAPLTGRQSIAALKSLYTGRTTRITPDITVEGYVTANDLEGEFYKTIVVEDATGGIEIHIDAARLYRRFRIFDYVSVQCCGLALGEYGGVLQLGLPPTGDYPVDRIPESAYDRYFAVQAAAAPREPLDLTFADLAPEHVNRYVRFRDVRFETPGIAWCDTDPSTGDPVATDRTLLDAAGRALTVRTDARCSYANEPLPAGNGSVCGILGRFNGRYQLRVMRHEVYFPASVR